MQGYLYHDGFMQLLLQGGVSSASAITEDEVEMYVLSDSSVLQQEEVLSSRFYKFLSIVLADRYC